MLAAQRLFLSFGGRDLFKNISFNVRPKERIGLIGKNGAGKSTLLKAIAGKINLDQGEISIPKTYKIGYLAQEINSESQLTVWKESSKAFKEINLLQSKIDNINNELVNRRDYESDSYFQLISDLNQYNDQINVLGGTKIESEIEKTLVGLGFEQKDFHRKLNEFSGGWQMRVELAKILLQKPDCLLLDEPTNHLDIESILWMEEFLNSYEGAVLLVSHDRRFLDNVTNRTIEISLGSIYDLNVNYSKFVIQREEQRKIQIAAKVNQDKQIKEIEDFVTRFRAKARQASRAQSKLKQIDKIDRIEIEEEDNSQIHFKFPATPRSARIVVSCENLSKSYGDKLVLNEIEFILERGEKVAFVGRNGEGKSTLAKIIQGLTDYQGDLKIGSNVIIGSFGQHEAQAMEDSLTPFEIIDRVAQGDMRTQIRSILGAFLFSGDDVYKKIGVLSGGERSRLAIAKLLLEPYNLLILDEPTNHLDMVSKDVLKNALLGYTGSLIVVSHDREFLESLTTKTYEFRNKKVKEYLGDINFFLSQRNIRSISEIEIKETQKNEAKNSISKKHQISNKEFQRELRRLNNQIEKSELEIEQLKQNQSKIETQLSQPDFHKEIDKLKDLNKVYEENKNKIEELELSWLDLSQELEELQATKDS